MTAAIETDRLTRLYGDVRALDELDLQVRAGEIFGLLGPNGAGKSTLIRILSTLLHPTSGRAWLNGFDVVEHPDQVRLQLGVALQEAALDPNQTGIELLELQGRLYGLRRAEIRLRLGEVTDLIHIGDALSRRISTYSVGMRRRLDLAAAIIHNPKILFLDEPTTGLDPASRHRVWGEIVRLNLEHDMTILLTTQYLDEADRLAGRVGFINKGRMVADGPPDLLKRSFGADVIVATVRVNPSSVSALKQVSGVQSVDWTPESLIVSVLDGARALGPIAVALAKMGTPADTITLRRPTLEEVFLELTDPASTPDDKPGPHAR